MTPSTILLIAAVICFALGALRPGLGGVSWTDAGLGFTLSLGVAGVWLA